MKLFGNGRMWIYSVFISVSVSLSSLTIYLQLYMEAQILGVKIKLVTILKFFFLNSEVLACEFLVFLCLILNFGQKVWLVVQILKLYINCITASSVSISVFVYLLDSEEMFAIKKDIFMKRIFWLPSIGTVFLRRSLHFLVLNLLDRSWACLEFHSTGRRPISTGTNSILSLSPFCCGARVPKHETLASLSLNFLFLFFMVNLLHWFHVY